MFLGLWHPAGEGTMHPGALDIIACDGSNLNNKCYVSWRERTLTALTISRRARGPPDDPEVGKNPLAVQIRPDVFRLI
ncbi:hypothetical protein EVAR_37606_1 [Eumeta japonica]|uniref:Uncharacterized protein n=1 Tax=Eumeta variegata TaxID=151549 RepID=A0A4C1VQW7_EUMVA|nr:hypothetical protein EVAR_37606_1 [Eumeta japonica]